MNATARLIVHIGTHPKREIVLGEGNVLIGRDGSNELVVQDSEASRHHCRIVLNATVGYVIEDLDSTNGTYVNGRRVTSPQSLQDGDAITLGRAVRIMFIGHAADIESMHTLVQDVGDTAAIFAPSPDNYVRSQPVARAARSPQPPINIEREQGCQRYFIYTGCAVLALFLITGVMLFAIDMFTPELLYCGVLQSLWEKLNPILRLFNRIFDCAVI